MAKGNLESVQDQLVKTRNILIVQDIDGVCIPLVKDPLTRKIDSSYVYSAGTFKNEFAVLTNGEHEGRRGVNRLIEEAIGLDNAKSKGLYLPGLAAGGVEYQDRYGNAIPEGLNNKEITFLKDSIGTMKVLMKKHTRSILDRIDVASLDKIINNSVLDTNYSPTINLNGLFNLIPNNVEKKIKLQKMLLEIMNEIHQKAINNNLGNSFYLHIAPNLGKKDNVDIIKYASKDDIGTTDIQFMIDGAYKEYGLIVLLNKYIKQTKGYSPLGDDFNARSCPKHMKDILTLCDSYFSENDMPLIVGVGDTVTSFSSAKTNHQLRGGSDRGFLYLIQEIGKRFNTDNKTILVDSSHGEVERPSLSNPSLKGITDINDPLKFNLLMPEGPTQYISFFKKIANLRMARYGGRGNC